MRLTTFIVTVHYRAWTESTHHKFDDTWHEQQPLEMVLGKGICLNDHLSLSLFLRDEGRERNDGDTFAGGGSYMHPAARGQDTKCFFLNSKKSFHFLIF